MKRTICLLLILLSLFSLISCSDTVPEDATKISFKSAQTYEQLTRLNGSYVTINGYMATSSPADGSFIFLMNMPYQSCPFCVPNTSQLSNTIEVYPRKGRSFDFTNQAIRVTGILRVAPEGETYTDKYGYEFNFRIDDAVYAALSSDEVGADFVLWQKIAEDGVVNEIYNMYNYLDFLCRWPSYYVNSYTDEKGQTHPGYYLYATDALHYIETKGQQFHYGYAEGYFSSIVSRLNKIDSVTLSDLVRNVEAAQDLAARALSDLKEGRYTYDHHYVEAFGQADDVYTLDNGDALCEEYYALYDAFDLWLSAFET